MNYNYREPVAFDRITKEEALTGALRSVGILGTEYVCTENEFENGLYRFVVETTYVKYEFYADGRTGEILGTNTEPQTLYDALIFGTPIEIPAPHAAA